MMSAGKIAVMLTVAVLTAAAPLGIMGYLHRKKGGRWLPFLIGAIFFTLFAMGLEGIFNRLVISGPLGPAIIGNMWLYALYGGLAAGIFEETGRLAAFRLVLRKQREPVTALSYGLGHGGIEAFLLVGLTMIANLSLGLAYSGGTLLPEAVTAAETIISTPTILFFWAGVERLSAMLLHVSNSVLVFAAAWTGKRWLFPAAILTHAAIDFIAVMGGSALSTAAVELIILAGSLLVALWAVRIYRGFSGKIVEIP